MVDAMNIDIKKFESQLNRWVERVKELTGKDIVSRELLKRLGEEAADRIRKRTRLGYGVPRNAAKRIKLKAMRQHSEPYANWRAENPGKLSEETEPKKHNLTLSGRMLSDLALVAVNTGDKSIDIGFSSPESLRKAVVNTERGWIFMHLSDSEIKGVSNFYKREVRKLVTAFNRG